MICWCWNANSGNAALFLLMSLTDWSCGKCSIFRIAHLHPCPSADQAHLKNAQKHRRQRDERTREAEIARAEAADLTLRLRKVNAFFLMFSLLLLCTFATQRFGRLTQNSLALLLVKAFKGPVPSGCMMMVSKSWYRAKMNRNSAWDKSSPVQPCYPSFG